MGWVGLARIDVEKSSSHHLSQSEIGGDNACSRHLCCRLRRTSTVRSGCVDFISYLWRCHFLSSSTTAARRVGKVHLGWDAVGHIRSPRPPRVKTELVPRVPQMLEQRATLLARLDRTYRRHS